MRSKLTIFAILFFCLLSFLPIQPTNAADQVELDFFYSETCPHCVKEYKFLNNEIEPKYENVKINKYVLSKQKNVDLLEEFYAEYEIPKNIHGYVPITFIDDVYYSGFNDRIAMQIESKIINLTKYEAADEPIEDGDSQMADELRKTVKVPFFGEIDLKNSSPLTLSIILGTLDGFNACAMIALGFLLAVLIGTGVRKKVILIGGTFILVSGAVYFLFISAWLNLFMITQNIAFITSIVAIIVIIFAILILRDYIRNIVCKICHINPKGATIWQKMEKYLFTKMQYYATTPMSTFLMLLGVAGVAVGINTVELVCSFGFPLAFTKALTDMGMSTGSYYFYLILYIMFYMLDDFIIFLIAVITLRVTGISDKYLKFVMLISGIMLLILGIVMLFKPSLLAFNL